MKDRIIAIDFGLKRTGLAITDENNIIAYGLKTVESKLLMEELSDIIAKNNVGVIVLGEPKRLDNSQTHISTNVGLLKEALENNFPSLKIVLIDERFTSKMASQALFMSGLSKNKRKQKELIDEVSATIILQSYLDAQKFV